MDELTNESRSVVYQQTSIAYDVTATIIFVVMAFVFFFPFNRFVPLDRRTAAAIAATFCYLSRAFLFPNKKMELENAVDFDVIILLAGIMVINYIFVHQRETKNVIKYTQDQIYENPKRGFWLVSFAAFATSPFLTNDGVCLLFVEPILNAFDRLSDPQSVEEGLNFTEMKLEKGDAFYFLLALACSTNAGSALTYTGNPQNMIVASDAIDVMPPIVFFIYMLLPATISWVATIAWIQRCWLRSRNEAPLKTNTNAIQLFNRDQSGNHIQLNPLSDSMHGSDNSSGVGDVTIPLQGKDSLNQIAMNRSTTGKYLAAKHKQEQRQKEREEAARQNQTSSSSPSTNDKPSIIKKVAKILISPFPYAIMFLMCVMIALIFVDIMSIAGLIGVTAVFMIIVLVIGNHWQGLPIFDGDENAPPLTSEEKIANTALFFDELFDSIDYALLIIFTGLFIVVDNVASTGIPKAIWDSIVGKKPFATFGSVFNVSVFILVASQLLGNVPVIQLALPNVEPLPDAEKRYAWAIISFVATLGGNLTITGSAANIIVAEKAARIDPNSGIDFFRHYAVCFWITLICCIGGAFLITATVSIDNSMRESW